MPHDEIAVMKLMQARGLRVTGQRLLILDAVCEGNGHTTLPEILLRVKELDPSIDPSTIYRTLDLFGELGFIAANVVSDGSTVYEIVGTKPHHHLVCTQCGREYNIADDTMQNFFDQFQQMYGFKVTIQHLMLQGLCEECRKDTLSSGTT